MLIYGSQIFSSTSTWHIYSSFISTKHALEVSDHQHYYSLFKTKTADSYAFSGSLYHYIEVLWSQCCVVVQHWETSNFQPSIMSSPFCISSLLEFHHRTMFHDLRLSVKVLVSFAIQCWFSKVMEEFRFVWWCLQRGHSWVIFPFPSILLSLFHLHSSIFL